MLIMENSYPNQDGNAKNPLDVKETNLDDFLDFKPDIRSTLVFFLLPLLQAKIFVDDEYYNRENIYYLHKQW